MLLLSVDVALLADSVSAVNPQRSMCFSSPHFAQRVRILCGRPSVAHDLSAP